MKFRILFTFCQLLQIVTAYSQPYKTIFATDTTKWTVYECVPDAGWTLSYYSYGDTTMENKLYHKLYLEELFREDKLVGYIHEDTLQGKYWYKKLVDNPGEAIFMDLSLKKGDTMPIISDFRYMRVDSVLVDTVYYEDNRKIIKLAEKACPVVDEAHIKFIEGVGASNGFYMAKTYEDPWPFALICKFENGKHVYSTKNNIQGNCIVKFTGIEENELNFKLDIYPNPTNSQINIKIGSYICQPLIYELFNILGQKIYVGEINSKVTTINIDKNGVYFITITDGKLKSTKKVIVN